MNCPVPGAIPGGHSSDFTPCPNAAPPIRTWCRWLATELTILWLVLMGPTAPVAFAAPPAAPGTTQWTIDLGLDSDADTPGLVVGFSGLIHLRGQLSGQPDRPALRTYRPENGQLVWEYVPPAGLPASSNTFLAVGKNGAVYAPFGSRVIAFDGQTGTNRWTSDDLGSPESLALGGDGTVYVAAPQKVFALHPETGRVLWSHRSDIRLETPLVVGANGHVYYGAFLGSDSGDISGVWTIEPSSGSTVATLQQSGRIPAESSGPTSLTARRDGTLCVGISNYFILDEFLTRRIAGIPGTVARKPEATEGADGTVYANVRYFGPGTTSLLGAYDATQGTRLWTAAVTNGTAAALAADGTLYVGANIQVTVPGSDNTTPGPALYALDSATGRQKWVAGLDRTRVHDPILAPSGMLYVRTTGQPSGGSLHAFYGTNPPAAGVWAMSRADAAGSGRHPGFLPPPALTIVTQPSSVAVARGATALFTVVARGAGALQYRWYKNGSLIAGATAATLTLANVNDSHAGPYVAEVFQADGARVFSQEASLTVTIPAELAILQHPQSVTVSEGQRATFTVRAEGAGTLVYRWMKDGVFLQNEVGPTLIVTNAFQAHAGTYQAVVSSGSLSLTSNPAVLTVLGNERLAILRQPESVIASVGDTVTLTVVARGTGSLTYRWYRDFGAAYLPESGPTLTLPNIQTYQGGYFRVLVSDSQGQISSDLVTVSVIPGPRILQQPQSVVARRGSDVVLSVVVQGKGPVSYKWNSSRGIPADVDATRSTLTLKNVGADHAGLYNVTVTDSTGTWYSDHATVSIRSDIEYASPGYVASLAAGRDLTTDPSQYYYYGNADAVGFGLAARFSNPNAGFVGPKGDVFIADTGNNRIKKITPTGMVELVAGSAYPGHADGPPDLSRFLDPIGLCVDASNNVYVAEYSNHRVRRIDAISGVVTTLAGSGKAGGDDGRGTGASFNAPNDLAVDREGNVFVTEFAGHRIRRIAPDGTVTTLAGTGFPEFSDGVGTRAGLNRPGGIAIDAAGNLFFTEWGNQRVRKLGTNGVVTTIAGTGARGYVDGPGASALFNDPDGIVVDPAGNLFITDRDNHAIRRITPAGMVETVAGTGTPGLELGSPGTARFNLPSGLGLAPNGELFVVDTQNRRVIRISPEPATPAILIQPQDVFSPAGKAVVLGVDAQGVGTLSYQWFKEGVPIPGAIFSTLLLSRIQPPAAGTYSVSVRDSRGETSSRQARVQVFPTSGPTITRQPADVSVDPDGSATFTVEATGTGPLMFQWLHHGSELGYERGPSLVLSNVPSYRTGEYSVRVKDLVGSVTSRVAVLRINPLPKPVILRQSESVSERAGADVTFFVEARTDGQARYQWVFYPDFPTFPREPLEIPGANSSSLTRRSISLRNQGTYYCSVRDRADQFVVSQNMVLTVLPAKGPYFVNQPRGQQVPFGTPVTLTVTVAGADPVFYQWYRDQVLLPGATSPTFDILPGDFPCCSIQSVYHVVASDSAGNANRSESASVYLYPSYEPVIVRHPEDRRAAPGATVTFEVQVNSVERLSFTWYRNDQIVRTTTTPTLTLTNISGADRGAYKVTVVNQWGKATSTSARLDLDNNIHFFDESFTVADAAGAGSLPGDEVGAAGSARFSSPNGGFVSPAGEVYVADTSNHRIKKITRDGQVSLVAGTGQPGFANGTPTNSQFNFPISVCVDAKGTVYVADFGNHSIRTIRSDGTVTTLAGSGLQGFQDGPGSTARFNQPNDLAIRPDGTLLVTEFGGHRIRSVTPDGTVATWAGNGAAGYRDGPRADAAFDRLTGIALDLAGSVYLTEWGGHRVRKVSPSGNVTTLAGTGLPGHTDGQLADAQFREPDGVVADGEGNLFIADRGNHAVRRISVTGAVDTVAGPGSAGDENGPVRSARLSSPSGIGLAADGTLYIADTSNHRIRRVAGAGARSPHLPTVMADSPVAFWRLGEGSGTNALDSLDRHHGTYRGPVRWIQDNLIAVAGSNSALQLNDVEEPYMEVRFSPALNPSSFSFDLWARIDAPPRGQARQHMVVSSVESSAPRGYALRALVPGSWELLVGDGDQWRSLMGSGVATNTWTHVAATYGGSRAHLFVNGTRVASASVGFAPNRSGTFRLGSRPVWHAFAGQLDEVGFYPGALAPARILAHYAAGARPKTLTGSSLDQRLALVWFEGRLQSAPDLAGPWTLVEEAASPWTPEPAGSHGFFRLVDDSP